MTPNIVGDLGTHAHHLARFVTDLEIGGWETDGGRSALIFPNGDDGVAGLAFIEAVVASSRATGRWTDISG